MKPVELSALEGVASAMDRGNFAGMAAARDALPVLIQIAKAALAWHEQRATMTAEAIEAESIEARRKRMKLTADLARALETALKAVRQ